MRASDPFSRRAFVASTAGVVAAAALLPAKLLSDQAASPSMTSPSAKLVHHVFFWLKNPDSKADLERLLSGIRTLSRIETVRGFHVGVPASTEKRPVVENSYSASEMLLFDTVEDQNVYQVDPIHMKFVEDCSHLWARVVVFDSIAV